MAKLLGTHVDGPLADYTTGFLAALKGQGFADWSATSYQGLMAHLSRWLVQHEWRPGDLTLSISSPNGDVWGMPRAARRGEW